MATGSCQKTKAHFRVIFFAAKPLRLTASFSVLNHLVVKAWQLSTRLYNGSPSKWNDISELTVTLEMQSWLNSKGRAGECWTQRLLGSSIASPHILILWPAEKKNIIIKSYAYLWKYVTKIVNSLTFSQLDSGWWSSARKCKEWKWGRWKGAWETSIRFQLNEKHITNAQQSTTCLFSDLVELNLYFCKIWSIKNS